MKYKSNRNIVFSCSYHVVFCPKYRRPVLVDGVDERFKEIAWEVADELGFEIAEMEVMPDHVHLLLSIDPQLSIHRAIKRIKGRSSHDVTGEKNGYEMVEQNEELKHILDSSSQIESAFDYEKYGRTYTEGGEVTVLQDGYIDNCADGPDVDYYDRDELASLIGRPL